MVLVSCKRERVLLPLALCFCFWDLRVLPVWCWYLFQFVQCMLLHVRTVCGKSLVYLVSFFYLLVLGRESSFSFPLRLPLSFYTFELSLPFCPSIILYMVGRWWSACLLGCLLLFFPCLLKNCKKTGTPTKNLLFQFFWRRHQHRCRNVTSKNSMRLGVRNPFMDDERGSLKKTTQIQVAALLTCGLICYRGLCGYIHTEILKCENLFYWFVSYYQFT